MSKFKNVFVVATQKSTIEELTAGARQLGEKVTLAYVGERSNAVNADKAYFFGDADMSTFLNCIPQVVELVKAEAPELVLVEPSKDGRLTAAHIAFAFKTSVLTDASSVEVDGGVHIKRMVYGGSAEKVESAAGAAVVCPSAGTFKAVDAPVPAAEIVDTAAGKMEGIVFIEKLCRVVQAVNLNAADKVVGVGRGFTTEESLSLARDLAEVLSAEIGCTRPIAEEEKWLPSARYIGVSGAMIKPALYVAAGISGQVQHMVGVNDSGMILAINKDENAPIFSNCDYGIVGDVQTVLPMLVEKLKS